MKVLLVGRPSKEVVDQHLKNRQDLKIIEINDYEEAANFLVKNHKETLICLINMIKFPEFDWADWLLNLVRSNFKTVIAIEVREANQGTVKDLFLTVGFGPLEKVITEHLDSCRENFPDLEVKEFSCCLEALDFLTENRKENILMCMVKENPEDDKVTKFLNSIKDNFGAMVRVIIVKD
jgi:hypothetical protein